MPIRPKPLRAGAERPAGNPRPLSVTDSQSLSMDSPYAADSETDSSYRVADTDNSLLAADQDGDAD